MIRLLPVGHSQGWEMTAIQENTFRNYETGESLADFEALVIMGVGNVFGALFPGSVWKREKDPETVYMRLRSVDFRSVTPGSTGGGMVRVKFQVMEDPLVVPKFDDPEQAERWLDEQAAKRMG